MNLIKIAGVLALFCFIQSAQATEGVQKFCGQVNWNFDGIANLPPCLMISGQTDCPALYFKSDKETAAERKTDIWRAKQALGADPVCFCGNETKKGIEVRHQITYSLEMKDYLSCN